MTYPRLASLVHSVIRLPDYGYRYLGWWPIVKNRRPYVVRTISLMSTQTQ